MASINNVTVKALKEFAGHDSMPCYQGNLYVGNKKIGFWSQDAHGAICDNFNLEQMYSEQKLAAKVKELNKDKERHVRRDDGSEFTIEYSMESLMTDILALIYDEKIYKKAVKNGYDAVAVLTDNYHVIAWYLKDVEGNSDEEIRKDLEPEISKALEDGELFKEDMFREHKFTVYRSLADFDIGTKIKLEDIM